MSKLLIEDTTLTAIGDAIRAQTGGTDKMTLDQMPDEIASITTGGEMTEFTLNKSASSNHYAHPTAHNLFNRYLNGKSFTIKLNAPPTALFCNSNDLVDLSKVVINYNASSGSNNGCGLMFAGCYKLEHLPKLNVAEGAHKKAALFYRIFQDCQRLRNIDSDLWSKIISLKENTETTSYNVAEMFGKCYSLRELPDMSSFDKLETTTTSISNQLFYSMFYGDYSLNTAENIPIMNHTSAITSNLFGNTFYMCHRLKNITFATDNGVPRVVQWSNQTIDLSQYVGWVYMYVDRVLNYNSGITEDKRVENDAAYQALKNDPDWFTMNMAYSRYNHDSAVNTINSLPDTSAYIASNGGTNTIKFTGSAGSKTDGGAINTLTPEEIAVATEKGWTVTLV